MLENVYAHELLPGKIRQQHLRKRRLVGAGDFRGNLHVAARAAVAAEDENIVEIESGVLRGGNGGDGVSWTRAPDL